MTDPIKANWRCGKCDGAKVPKHFRTCPLRNIEELVSETVKALTDAGETHPDIIRNALIKAKFGIHHHAPKKFGDDWCGFCGQYFTHPIHERALPEQST